MSLTPHQARLLLAMLGETTGSIRPGEFTGAEALEVIQDLKRMASE